VAGEESRREKRVENQKVLSISFLFPLQASQVRSQASHLESTLELSQHKLITHHHSSSSHGRTHLLCVLFYCVARIFVESILELISQGSAVVSREPCVKHGNTSSDGVKMKGGEGNSRFTLLSNFLFKHQTALDSTD
jgi:hypothetical protein